MAEYKIQRSDTVELFVQLSNQRTGIAANTAVAVKVLGLSTTLYLDWSDLTFKSSVTPANKFAALSEVDATNEPGYYRRLLDLSATTALPDSPVRLLAEYKVNATSPTLTVSGTDVFEVSEGLQTEVRQAWVLKQPNAMIATVHLEHHGERVTLPGAATCSFQGYTRAGVAIAGLTGSGTLRTVGSETWFDCSGFHTPVRGEPILVLATISGSGVLEGVHSGMTAVAFADF